jgi:amino acid adenylation domain-containing protein
LAVLKDSEREALHARLRRGRENVVSEIPRRAPGRTDLPLSYGQEQLWFLDHFAPGMAAYNIPIAVGLSGPLDVAALSRALGGLAARHEALRTRLVVDPAGRPVQVISPPGDVPVEVVELAGPELGEFIDSEAVRPFSLAEGPLLRAQVVRLAEREHVLLLVVHHAVFDGWSIKIFTQELAALYGQEAGGQPADVAELPVQFADYALWERGRLESGALEELETYWRQTLSGFEAVQFPADRPRPMVDQFEGGLAQRMTDAGLLEGLRELSRREGTTLFVTLMAALLALLQRYTGQDDLVVGTVSANRTRSELTSMIGFLVNTLPIRCDLSGDPTFTEVLARVREVTTGAYAHQDLPFGKLVETLRVERDPGRAPVFQIAMTYTERDSVPVRAAGVDFVLTDLVTGINAAKFDLSFLAEGRDGGLWLECSYKTGLFDAETIERLLDHLEVLLRGVVADPGARLSELPVLSAAEREQELVSWNDTAAEVPPWCVHQGFEAQVAAAPEAVAAEFGDERVSYAELNAQANRIARRLRELGVGPEALVGVHLPIGVERLAVLLGVWKAGGGYVPLDPGLPAERLRFLVEDTGMPVVVTDAADATALPGRPDVTVLCLDAERELIAGLDGGNVDSGVAPSNVAYVLYTSGSTGAPKGVVVEHRQVLNFLHGMVSHWRIDGSHAVLSWCAFTFDISVIDMFMPLLGGARVVMAAAEVLHSPPRLASLIRGTGVTFACLTPTVLALLAEEEFPSLRILLSVGEELPSELARPWIRPGLCFVNAYGPTEATVVAVYQELDGEAFPPPIGRPGRPNYLAYVLDRALNPVPTGVLGELYIGGAGVARGYLRRPELTRERFIADPFRPGGRLYKTGDLVRRRPDGVILFAGRTDDQVKIHGLRIELGEIEAVLERHPSVAQAVVVVITDAAGEKQLAAYARPTAGVAADPGELRAHLSGLLPAYMVPGYLMVVDEIPLSRHGKVDKAALPEPVPVGAGGQRVAPVTLLETFLAHVYATVLGNEQAGATDSFFDIGGNSLQAMQLITQLRATLAVDVGISALFLAPSPRELAALLRDKHGFEDTELGDDGIDGLGDASTGYASTLTAQEA